MAARFKKRPPGNDNKLLKLDYLNLYDLICTVCQSIYIEPVTLPCNHDFCLACFNGSIENNALSCPLCRTRIGSWLRTATKQNTLVNVKLWQFIQQKFSEEIKTKLKGEELNILNNTEDKRRKICAPGEIRSEYEAEIEKARQERRKSEEKHSKDTADLIRKLQECEKAEAEALASKVKEDELLAQKLAKESAEPPPQLLVEKYKSITAERRPPVGGAASSSSDFYRRLGNTTASQGTGHLRTVDSYFVKKNGESVNRLLGMVSPELMSTAGRCGRFLKNFLSSKLWGATKVLPKRWEPEGLQELSVGVGDPDTASMDSLAPELRYFKPLHPQPITRLKGKLARCIPIRSKPEPPSEPIPEEKDAEIWQLVSALEKLKGYSIGQHSSRSAFLCLLSVPVSCVKNQKPCTESRRRKKTPLETSSKSKKSSDRNGFPQEVTPKKCSPRKPKAVQISKSCVKLGSREADQDRVFTRSKRSISFGNDIHTNGSATSNGGFENGSCDSVSNGVCKADTDNQRVLRNGHVKCKHATFRSPKKVHHPANSEHEHINGHVGKRPNGVKESLAVNRKKKNDTILEADVFSNGLAELNPAILEEQRRIEEMIAQEKRDLVLAKKLQRQLRGSSFFTGYTVRTGKRQATLKELLPAPKKMKV